MAFQNSQKVIIAFRFFCLKTFSKIMCQTPKLMGFICRESLDQILFEKDLKQLKISFCNKKCVPQKYASVKLIAPVRLQIIVPVKFWNKSNVTFCARPIRISNEYTGQPLHITLLSLFFSLFMSLA